MDQASFNETPARAEPITLSGSRTPLGEPMDQFSAASLAEDPIEWHKRYWYSLWFVGVAYGEDAMLMAVRIEMEIQKIPDADMANELGCFWIERRRFTEGEAQYRRSPTDHSFRLQEKIIRSGKQKRLYRDVERMLVDKGQKTRAYLLHLESWLDRCSRALSRGSELSREEYDQCHELREEVRELYYQVSERVRVLYQRLDDEELAERRQFLVRDQGVQRPQASETKHPDNDDDLFN